jgi:hypothetical protein
MDCNHYVGNFLSAHADGELRGREERLADAHISSCLQCHRRLSQERELKRLIRSQSSILRVPADLRMDIRTALGEVVDTELLTQRPAWRRCIRVAMRGAAHVGKSAHRHPIRYALPIAAVGLLMILGIKSRDFRSIPPVPATPVFNLAVNRFDSSIREFAPNVTPGPSQTDSDFAWVIDRGNSSNTTDEADDLARSYREAGIPEDIYDFRSVGYGLYGGRIDRSADDYPAAYTLYIGERGEILSVCVHAANFAAPIGARYWAGTHTFYEYQGHSICLTFHPAGHFVSILVSREPVTALLRDVTGADAASSEF